MEPLGVVDRFNEVAQVGFRLGERLVVVVQTLQATLDASLARAGPCLRASFAMPTPSLSAPQLVGLFHGLRTVALATVTATDTPPVAPVGAFF